MIWTGPDDPSPTQFWLGRGEQKGRLLELEEMGDYVLGMRWSKIESMDGGGIASLAGQILLTSGAGAEIFLAGDLFSERPSSEQHNLVIGVFQNESIE